MKKLYVSYEGFVRYLDSPPCGVKVYEAESVEKALADVLDYHMYGMPTDEYDFPLNLSKEQILQEIEKNNGDGCDYIISIIEITDAIVIFDAEHQN